jgi:triacylglycerol lipase
MNLALLICCAALCALSWSARADDLERPASLGTNHEASAQGRAMLGAPRDTVVLLHGIAGVPLVMKRLEWSLRRAGYEVHSIGYPSTRHGIEELARDHVGPAIEKIQLASGARLHFVTHSMGGLVLRQWLREQTPESLARVVMLGPPNQGSEVADWLKDTSLYQFVLGPSGQQLGTGVGDFPRQLGPVQFPLGVIAGDCSLNPFFSRRLPGRDDGKVSVASTRVAGMADFVTVRATHTSMVWRRPVLDQVRSFLATGKFQRAEAVPY